PGADLDWRARPRRAQASGSRSILANSAFSRMLSLRTLRDAPAIRSARARASASRFIRSIARRMYSARGMPSALAQRSLVSSRSCGSFSEIDSIICGANIALRYLQVVCALQRRRAIRAVRERDDDQTRMDTVA